MYFNVIASISKDNKIRSKDAIRLFPILPEVVIGTVKCLHLDVMVLSF